MCLRCVCCCFCNNFVDWFRCRFVYCFRMDFFNFYFSVFFLIFFFFKIFCLMFNFVNWILYLINDSSLICLSIICCWFQLKRFSFAFCLLKEFFSFCEIFFFFFKKIVFFFWSLMACLCRSVVCVENTMW